MGWAQGHFTEIISIALQRIINLIICLNIILVIYSHWYLPRIAVTCNKDIKIFDVKILIEASFLVAEDRDILSIGQETCSLQNLQIVFYPNACF